MKQNILRRRGCLLLCMFLSTPLYAVVMTCFLLSLSLWFPISLFAEGLAVIPDLDKPFGGSHPKLTKSLFLSGARGETVSFFLRLPQGTSCSWPTMSFASMRDGSAPTGSAVFSYLPHVTIKNPSYTGAPVGQQLDPVLPLAGNKVCLSANGVSWLFGEYRIHRGATAGLYTGNISFDAMQLPVTLRVWKMQMPNSPSYPMYTEMTTWWNLLGHYGKWTNSEASLSRQYLKMLRAHRLETLTTTIAVPEMNRSSLPTSLDLTNKPTPDQSFTAMNINGRAENVHLGFPTIPREEVGSTKSKEYLKALENTLPTLQRSGPSMLYAWDEPQIEEFPKLLSLLRDVRTFAPSMKTMVTTVYDPRLANLVDIFAPVADEIGGRFPAISKYRALQSEGKEFWWYVSCMSHGCEALADSGVPDLMIDRPSVYARSIGWLGTLIGTDAFLYYHVNQAYQYFPERDPWNDLWDFSGNGDGTLLYPGRPGIYHLTEHQPVASLRLKLLRQASYDAQYVEWMESLSHRPAWWTEAKRVLVTDFRNWSKDYWKYTEIRKRMGDFLNQQK